MNDILLIAVVVAGFGFLLVIFKLLKKGSKLAAKLPANFLIFFLLFATLGLLGFSLKGGVTERPFLISLLLFLVSLSGGTIITERLYEKWEWSANAPFWRKLLYLLGLLLTGAVSFTLVFLLCEHRGWPKEDVKADLVWWFASIITIVLLPLFLKQLHLLWNAIPKISQIRTAFKVPPNTAPPFFETGGATVKFLFVIPLEYRSREKVKSKVSVPLNKTLQDAFHYKLHEYNIVKRMAKKIVYAEEKKLSKMYGWYFYRSRRIWWGLWEKRDYIHPASSVGPTIANGETIFVERVKIWEP